MKVVISVDTCGGVRVGVSDRAMIPCYRNGPFPSRIHCLILDIKMTGTCFREAIPMAPKLDRIRKLSRHIIEGPNEWAIVK